MSIIPILNQKSLSNTNSNNNIFKDGYLLKQGGAKGGSKTWKKRFFILREEALYYYKCQEDMVLLGVIPLKNATIIDVVLDDPPVWDQKMAECWQCKKEFNLFTRKHHCRNCIIMLLKNKLLFQVGLLFVIIVLKTRLKFQDLDLMILFVSVIYV